MLARRVRVSPWRERSSRPSEARATVTRPSATATFIRRWTRRLRVPLGPFTVTSRPSTFTSTPWGKGMGILPMRDISPHLADHLSPHPPPPPPPPPRRRSCCGWFASGGGGGPPPLPLHPLGGAPPRRGGPRAAG